MSVARFLLICALCSGCEDTPLPETAADMPPTRDVGDAPNGYPVGFPLVPGGRVLEGGVDRGVIRTSVLQYESACEALEQALRAAFREAGGRVIDKAELPDGRVSLRVAIGTKEASFSMHTELSSCMLRTVSSDRADEP